MKAARLTQLPVKHLEYVFSPPGLPLPVKGESDQGTTSVLVRGGAGTGKTTFALALAHAIAKAEGGLVLYLTTEFSPVEIAFKATLIGLAESVVDVWPGAEGLVPGGVVVEHLSIVRNGRPVLSSADRKRGVIDAVWGLLHPEKEGEKRPPLPVRAVVIDALTLPEVGESEGALRADLVAFVQALENEGMSVVLVEELAPGASAWSSFVVDVVFELSFQPDVETQDLRRKLTVSKCRYAISIPGPHDYGLENGVPGVWPDLFRVVTVSRESTEVPLFRAVPPRLMLAVGSEGGWVMLNASVVLSPVDKTTAKARRVLRRTPGAAEMMIDGGAMTLIHAPFYTSSVNEDDGIHAIGWAVLSCAKQTKTNVCFIQGFEKFLSRPGSTARVSRLLEALCLLGFLVCVHSPLAAMQSLHAMADTIWGTQNREIQLLPRNQRRFARRCLRVPWFEESAAVTEALGKLEGACDMQALQAAAGKVTELSGTLYGAMVQEWIGVKMGKERIASLLKVGGKEGHQSAWFALHAGAEWHAARAALAAVESETPDPSVLLLWKAVCAAIAKNLVAIDELKKLLGSPDEPLILEPLLRGLAGTNQIDEADRIITDVGVRYDLAPWKVHRLRADVRLDSEAGVVLRDAMLRFTSLTQDESLPLIDRAEIWHNLGTAQDRLGERAAAIAAFERASVLNPFLDAAREELERLRAPEPTS